MIEKNNSDNDFRPWGMEINQFCMLMHLSQFAGYFIPLAGLVLPIIMWSTNKDQSELIDAHGKNIINWIISSLIYVAISMLLMIVFIGFFTLIAFLICALIFIILGAIKASDGIIYEYPLTIKFIK